MSAAGAPVPLGVSAASAPETRARAFLAIHGRAFGIAGDPNVAHFRSHGPDEVGMEHVRFQQLHGGIPVTGGELTVHLRGAAVVAVNSKTLEVEPNVPVTPAITADEALATAEALIAKHFAVTDAVYSTPRLEVFNRGMLTGNRAATHLAWFIEATRIDLRQFIWIDATTGARLLDFSQLTDALNRSVYTAGGGSTLPGTLVRSEGGAPTGDADA